jgi:hypothetical protein
VSDVYVAISRFSSAFVGSKHVSPGSGIS